MKLFIISNRLPLKASKKEGELVFSKSEGGLATGLDSLQMNIEKHWIGWPGIDIHSDHEKKQITEYLAPYHFHPVFLSSEQVHEYYEGYSNSTIWPLCHYFYSYIQYENTNWQTYRTVNELFCQTAQELITKGDIVWVQDYQLMLLPELLRRQFPDISIGYFHHIPFPSYELFRVLPERAEILHGLLGADLIAFHTYAYMRHFVSAVNRVLRYDFQLGDIELPDRKVHVDALPMGINYKLYHDAPLTPVVQKHAEKLIQTFGGHKLILSVDRLDYSKGILHRLKGFSQFLENHAEWREKVSLVIILVPSRDHVDAYAELKTKIDEMIGAINGTYSTLTWTPVYYFYHAFPFEELVAIYYLSEIALVTPLRDGMNLVAKEYLATKRDKPGVLILSEMAGAAIELRNAIIINPNNINEIEKALLEALEMQKEEQLNRLFEMQKTIACQTVDKWAQDFLNELEKTREKNNTLSAKIIDHQNQIRIKKAYHHAQKRLILLDYDGTLVGFKNNPLEAVPGKDIYFLLRTFYKDYHNHIAICSGRSQQALEQWFGHLPIQLIAEHGAFYKDRKGWHNSTKNIMWNDEILHIIRQIMEKTPGSKLEIKHSSLAWHYRNVDLWLSEIRKQQLIQALREPCTRLNLQILEGNKVLEIKSPCYNKGKAAKRLLSTDHFDFIMAIGDDTTDEDMFQALPKYAVTIKIGAISNNARYNLPVQEATLPFLKALL